MGCARHVDPQARSVVLWPALALVYGTALGLCFALVVYGRQNIADVVVDLNGFGSIARHLANGEGFSTGNGPTTRRAPLYPFVGAALLRLFGHDAPGASPAEYFRPILVANCVVLGLTTMVVFSLARMLFDRGTAIVAAAICPLLPQTLRYVGMTEVETMMALWSALLALTGVHLVRRPGSVTGAAFGAVAAAATLTKAIALLYLPAFAVVAVFVWRKQRAPLRPRLAALAVALACFGAPLVPWMLRNHSVTDGELWGLSSNGPGEFLRGYVNAQPKYFLLQQDFGGSGPGEKWDPEANAYEERLLRPYGVTFYRHRRLDSGETRPVPDPPPGMTSAMIEAEKDAIESAEMKRRLLHEPGAFVKKFAVQLFTFWYIVETRAKSLFVGSIAVLVLALSVLGLCRARAEGTTVWPVVLVIVYFNAMYAAFLAFARYSMPLFPTLSVLAAAGLVSLWSGPRRANPGRGA